VFTERKALQRQYSFFGNICFKFSAFCLCSEDNFNDHKASVIFTFCSFFSDKTIQVTLLFMRHFVICRSENVPGTFLELGIHVLPFNHLERHFTNYIGCSSVADPDPGSGIWDGKNLVPE
jgi:hypothetical protein